MELEIEQARFRSTPALAQTVADKRCNGELVEQAIHSAPVRPSGQSEPPNITISLPPFVWLALALVIAFALAPNVCLALIKAMQDWAVVLLTGGAGALAVRSSNKRERRD